MKFSATSTQLHLPLARPLPGQVMKNIAPFASQVRLGQVRLVLELTNQLYSSICQISCINQFVKLVVLFVEVNFCRSIHQFDKLVVFTILSNQLYFLQKLIVVEDNFQMCRRLLNQRYLPGIQIISFQTLLGVQKNVVNPGSTVQHHYM